MGHAARTSTKLRQEGKMLKIEIVFTPETGNLSITGPIDQKIICLGILAEAAATVQAYHQKKAMDALEKKLVEVPTGLVIPPHIGKRD